MVNIIQSYASSSSSTPDAIYNVYMIPDSIIEKPAQGQTLFPGQTTPKTATMHVAKPNSIDGYTPVNNKLWTYPYNYLVLDNNNGSSNILHWERFTEFPYDPDYVDFKIIGVPLVGGSVKCVPWMYDNIEQNEAEGIFAGKFPTLNWANDEYINWLTQNATNIGLGIASNGLQIASGLASAEAGVGVPQVVSGIMGIANTLNQIHVHDMQPNSARGSVNGGDLNVCNHKNGFFFYAKSIKNEYAQIIDKYFSMYGYKVNMVKVPNITGRTNWNYVKTINCDVEGNIPVTDLEVIRAMFNRGVTLWHNATNFLNYAASNSIVS